MPIPVLVIPMDNEIIGQTLALANLYTQTNPRVYRPPAEILEIIFIHCARDYFSEHDGRPIPFAPSWVNVSYVNRHWRTIALDCPTLWSYLFITSARWTKELLARSKQAPLKLRMDLRRHEKTRCGLPFLEQTMNHSERIQEFYLHLSLGGGNQRILSKLSLRAPRLQHLQILVDRYSFGWSMVPFGGDTPALSTLQLTGCPMWYSLKLSSLTILSITRVPDQFRLDVMEFLPTLTCMQDLTRLYLAEALASAARFLSSAEFHSVQKIKLPHLSRLAITAPLSAVTALLCCVNIPLKTEVMAHCQFEHDFSSFDDYWQLCSLLAQRLHMYDGQEPSSPTIRSLVIMSTEQGETNPVHIIFGSSEACEYDPSFISAYHVEWGYPLQILLSFGLLTSTSDKNRIVGHVCCPIPLPNIQNLHVLKPPSSSAFWMHILGYLQSLRYIKLSEGRMPALVPLLSLTPHDYAENMGEHTDRGSNQIFVPLLENLELCDIAFRATAPTYPSKDIVQALRDVLSTRKGCRLTVTQCTASHDSNDLESNMAGRRKGGRSRRVRK